MNPKMSSSSRISWTNQGLNVMLPIYRDIKELQVVKAESEPAFVKGTLADAGKLKSLLEENWDIAELRSKRRWKPDFWYDKPQPDMEGMDCPSDLFEEAFDKVVDVYLRHQFAWDEANPAVLLYDTENLDEDESQADFEDEDADAI